MVRFQDPGCTIFVKNIESRVTEEHLWELFLQAGPLRNVSIPLDRGTGKKRNFAFVTYRDEISVGYACELFNEILLFKRAIYCSPSNRDKPSFNQTPSNRSISTSDVSQSPASLNNSLIDGILNRSNSTPVTSTPFNGKRKFFQDPKNDSNNKSNSRVTTDYDRESPRYNPSSDRERGRYGEHDDRDRNRYESGGRFDDSAGYRSKSRDERDSSVGYRSDSREERDTDRRYDDRNSAQSSRYDRSNSQNSSYGNLSPMHMQALNQSHNQYGRQNSPSNETSEFGPMRQDSNRNARRQRTNPY